MARSKKSQAAIDDAMSLHVASNQIGLGVDLVEISRMRRILERTPSFPKKMFSDEEIKYCESKPDPATHYAARFAAKEAVVKALGTGFSQGIGVKDIEVTRDNSGRPKIKLFGVARQIADDMGVCDFPISLSHTRNDAIACAIAITKSSVEAAEERLDPALELSKRFKEARNMLDGI